VTQLLHVGDRVIFDEVEHRVTALAGTWVRLVDMAGAPTAVLLTHLVASPEFAILDAEPAPKKAWPINHWLVSPRNPLR
jgi:hypothetical protein